MVQRPTKQEQNRANGVSDATSPFLGSAPDHSMSFDVKDVVEISVPNVSTSDVTAKGANGKACPYLVSAPHNLSSLTLFRCLYWLPN